MVGSSKGCLQISNISVILAATVIGLCLLTLKFKYLQFYAVIERKLFKPKKETDKLKANPLQTSQLYITASLNMFCLISISKEKLEGERDRKLLLLTIHLPLIWQYDLPPSTRRVDGQSFLKALLNVWAPHPFRIPVQSAVRPVSQSLSSGTGTLLLRPIRAATATPLRRNDDGSSYNTPTTHETR